MKEDVLEQIVDDYLQANGYFTIHNVRFKPRADHPDFRANDDRVPSDVDVIGVNPRRRGRDRVWVVSCKSWQSGFDAARLLRELRNGSRPGRRERWKYFRELWIPKWSEALRTTVEQRTGSKVFRYFIAVTRLNGDAAEWRRDPTIRANVGGVEFLTLETMWTEYLETVGTTPQSSEIGRLAQLLKAARLPRGV